MTEKKQIEEMAKADLIEVLKKVPYGVSVGATFEQHFCEKVADHLYNAGYRKQSEGEWTYENTLTCLVGTDATIECRCTICGRLATNPWDFCPNCGAKMKGDDSIWNILQCSACGYVADTLCHCCPSCGAKMRGDSN
jgi:hypothetical protein